MINPYRYFKYVSAVNKLLLFYFNLSHQFRTFIEKKKQVYIGGNNKIVYSAMCMCILMLHIKLV